MRTIRSCASCAPRSHPAGPDANRPRADDGRVPRRPPLADPPGASRVRRRRRVAVRQPDAVQRRGDLSAYPRDEARDAATWPPTSASTSCSLPSAEEVYPRRLRDDRAGSPASPTGSRATHRGRAHFDGVTTVVTKLFNMVGARRRLLRAEGRTAGDRDQAPGARPRHAGADRGLPDRPRAGRARDVEPQRPPDRRRARAGDALFSARCTRSQERSRPASAIRPQPSPLASTS